MGIILGALGGAGDAMQKVGSDLMQASIKRDELQQSSDLALQREQALAQFKSDLEVNTATQQRQAMVDRIAPVQQNILNQGIISKATNARAANLPAYDPSDTTGPASFHGDANSVLDAINSMADGPDKQAALAQLQRQLSQNKAGVGTLTMDDLTPEEKARFAPSSGDKADAYTQAAIQTGDIAPKDAMNNASKLEINQLKMQSLLDRANDRNATMQQISDVRADAMRYGYELRLQAAQERTLNGKIDNATGRMLITSEDANIKASTSQMMMLNGQLSNMSPTKDGKPNQAYLDVQNQITSLRSDIEQSKANKAAYLKDMGLLSDTPAPAPAPPSPLPAPTPTAKRPPLSQFFK